VMPPAHPQEMIRSCLVRQCCWRDSGVGLDRRGGPKAGRVRTPGCLIIVHVE
jgi:hypothetical protein